jgi:hypothetical protein
MPKLPKLRKARQDTLAQISLIEEMRRGSVTRQFIKSKTKSKAEPIFTGPYALFTCKKEGRTVGRRLHDLEEIRRLEHQVENYHTFQNLCRKLVDIGEQICEEKDKEQGQ